MTFKVNNITQSFYLYDNTYIEIYWPYFIYWHGWVAPVLVSFFWHETSFGDQFEIIAFKLTSGNLHGIKAIEPVSTNLRRMLFGNKGYVGKKIDETLLEHGLKLITKVGNNIKKPLLEKLEKQLLRRSIIETIIDHLKTTSYRIPDNDLSLMP